MKIEQAPTYWARIYIAGDLATIKQVCREHCMAVGLCVTVDPTTYVYTGGEEAGAVVGLINYPRFPASPEEIFLKARELGEKIMERCCQHSFSIMAPDETVWFSRRPD
jgi:ferredoxin